MMKIYKSALPVFLCLISFSCSKEAVPLSISDQIQEIIKNNNVTRVIPANSYSEYFNHAYEPSDTYGLLFSIKGDFVTVDQVSWNLTLLKNYRIDVINKTSTMGIFY